MEFEWDEDKRQLNITKHNLDFVDAYRLFESFHVFERAATVNGEDRWLMISENSGKYIALVFTWREARIRIISMRRARDGEKRRYQALLG